MSMPPQLPAYDPRDHPPQIRAADTHREAVAARVREAVDDGRLQLDEIDERLGAVYEARTHGDLVKVVDDIVPARAQRSVPSFSVAPYPATRRGVSDRTILPALLLGVPFGIFGAHRFYAGQTRTAVAMLVLTLIGIGAPITVFWWLFDLIVLCLGNFRDGKGGIMRNWL